MTKNSDKDLLSWSDRELVVAFKQGDERAYDEIYRRHSPKLRMICSRRLGHRHDAEEALQETFLRAYQALPRFNGQYKLGPWLNRIAVNVCIDQLRHRNRSAIVADIQEAALEPVGGPDELIASSRPEVAEALAEIKPLHAQALKLQLVDGLSHEEVAGKLQLSPTQVKSLLHRARASFRRVLRGASGWIIAPVVFLRRGRAESSAVPIGAGVPQTMGLLAAIHASLPTAEKVLSGSVVAVLAFSASPTPTDVETQRTAQRAVVNDPGLARLSIEPGVMPTAAAVGTAITTAATDAVDIELLIETSGIKSGLDEVKERAREQVARKLDNHEVDDDGPIPLPAAIDPETIEQVLDEPTEVVEETVTDTSEGLLGDS
jgi:RNA polymerase sigma factor (sigma-70 family)